jgi:hypothetical protein
VEKRAWINEFHYDNAGADPNEGVEVAGPAGADLSAYLLVLYNGANGRVYAQAALSGRLGDEGGGFGAAWFDVPGLQNEMDGMALVRVRDGQTNVLEFLSYEGAFTAADGAAAGLRSRDIGVMESGTGWPDQSLQRTGAARRPSEFVWTGPKPHSRGRLNEGQTPRPPPTVLFAR